MARRPADPFDHQRRRMVQEQLVARGIRDPAVLRAMGEVPRHRFVPPQQRPHSYEDRPLPIGAGQTISQPYMVALMTELLQVRPGAKVLEVGTGSGYQAAVLDALGARVYSIERIPELVEAARDRLARLGYHRVTVRQGDGSLGWPEHAPFDGIILTAYVPELPPTLLQQMAPEGRMVAPVGDVLDQRLVVAERCAGKIELRPVCGCLFVPLIRAEGAAESRGGSGEEGMRDA